MDLLYTTFAYQFISWLLISSIIGIFSYKSQFLNLGGLIAAMIIGTTIFVSGGIRWIVPLVFFFLFSSILTRLSENNVTGPVVARSARTSKQVIANGGMAAIAALGYLFFPNYGFQLLFL